MSANRDVKIGEHGKDKSSVPASLSAAVPGPQKRKRKAPNRDRERERERERELEFDAPSKAPQVKVRHRLLNKSSTDKCLIRQRG